MPPAAAAPNPPAVPFPFAVWGWLTLALLLLRFASFSALATSLFELAVAASYAGIALLPVLLAARLPRAVAAPAAVLVLAALQLLLIGDARLFALYGFHVNGFVWNLVTTPGGLESLGAGPLSWLSVAGLTLATLLADGAALMLARRWPAAPKRGVRMLLMALLVLAGMGERVGYAVSMFRGDPALPVAADGFPFYQPLTVRHLGESLGFEPAVGPGRRIDPGAGRLRYPLAPLQLAPLPDPPNILWLVAESLRADALRPDVMPATSAFADESVHFTHHYSGGNGTRMGLFSQFYGLHGSYWFEALREGRPPLLMDVLARRGYDVEAWTSADFRYPEFDRTLFAGLDRARLHDRGDGPGWQRDETNTGALIDFMHRPRTGPFFAFAFFESPHARYWFPPRNAIRTPYLDELNYADPDLTDEMPLIRNRYLNACNHLDEQFARLIDDLRSSGLLASTIVIITGDHGEEFMEHGHWGHNSTFVDQQIRVPLVIAAPGEAPRRVNAMTSHVDLAATLLRRLGVTNPADQLGFGTDLLGPRPGHDHVVVADWNRVAWITDAYKAVYPVAGSAAPGVDVTTADDRPVADPDAVLAAHADDRAALLAALARFRAHGD